MFEVCSLDYFKNDLIRDLNKSLSSSKAYIRPFNCEYRAYGRLSQEDRLDLAVPAHGYLFLTPQQEAEVTPMITGGLEYEPGDEEPLGTLKGEKPWGRWEEHGGQPVRVIVKKFVEYDENGLGTDPREYDWLRWEEDGEAAIAYSLLRKSSLLALEGSC